ncbi:centromere protein U [Oryzias melastigma]|uniref:Centromere protein U n=1 Tax=Oryzias melastigma TaxID=30732 RepID=A0A3B3DTU6_ORYME|nr:centromere protein U [Oryzias melastigma]
MSAKKGRRRTKALPEPQKQRQMKTSSLDQVDSSTLSSVDKASFMEGLQRNVGMPLHSTAMEEDLHDPEDRQIGERTKNSDSEQNADKNKRKRTIKDGPQGVTTEHTDGKEKEDSSPILPSTSHSVRKKPVRRRTAGQTAAGRPLKSQKVRKTKNKERKLSSGENSDVHSQEESDSARRRSTLSSEDEEESNWKPSPKKRKALTLGSLNRKSKLDQPKRRKSSSGGTTKELKNVYSNENGWRLGSGAVTDLEVVLDAFLNMCEQYRESVESPAVRRSIDYFSNNVKEQLLEKISSNKELRLLKRENTKMGSLIRTKSQRLLDAKNELMSAKRQVGLLEKEKAELQQRLEDLRRGQAFLHDIRELTGRYLEYRQEHPSEKETYGASSLPALLLEAKMIQAAKHQQKGNDGQQD